MLLEKRIGSDLGLRIIDLEYIIARALRIMRADEVGSWLCEGEPLFRG